MLSTESLGYLADLGLSPAREIRVRPVGLPPVSWDGEGHAEWLSTDEPCICISSDHPLKGLTLNLQGSVPERLDLLPQESGERFFVKLPALPAGEHVLHILVQSSDDQIRIGRLEVAVRTPRPWSAGLTEQNALLVIPDPPSPSLEQFWESDVKVQVYGPSSRQARCDLRFYSDVARNSIVLDKKLAPFSLPLDAEGWNSYFQENVLNDGAVQSAYDSATGCELAFTAEELGRFTLTCQREFSPLRWMTRWDNHGYVLRLRDDTGDPSGVRVSRFEFERPDVPIAMAAESWQRPLRVPDSGGLYCAQSSDCMRSIILPPVLHSFVELRAESILGERPRSAESLGELVRYVEIWSGASLTGNPFTARKRAGVLATFGARIIRLACGEDWESHEAAFCASAAQVGTLKSAISRKPMESGFGAALLSKYPELAEKGLPERIAAFSQFARSYLPLAGFSGWPPLSHDLYLWTAEFVLRLMSRPQTLAAWAGEKLILGMGYALQCPGFARGARFFVLAVGSAGRTGPVRRINPPNWEWQ